MLVMLTGLELEAAEESTEHLVFLERDLMTVDLLFLEMTDCGDALL